MNKTILLTGGHITPAVAVAQAIKRAQGATRIVLAGRTETGMGVPAVEKKEIERVGGIFSPVVSGKLHRYFTLEQISEIKRLVIGFGRANDIIRKERPTVIVSFGGYLAFPFVVLAKLFNIPLVIHEETTTWGAVNNISRHWANAVAVSWPRMETQGTVLTGNPIPDEVVLAGKEEKNEGKNPVLYVTGGNQGSITIDRALQQILPKILEKWVVYHQSQQPLLTREPKYKWSRWFATHENARILSQTTVSVSRSGANTITNLAYIGIPSVLIPLGISAGNEQLLNAQMFADTGLAQVILEKDLTPKVLLSAITHLYKNCDALKQTAGARARALIVPDAADRMAKLILNLS